MSLTKELSDVLKSAQTATSLSGLLTLFVNSSGELQTASLMKEVTYGSTIVKAKGVWLIVVYSKTDQTRMNLSIALRNSNSVVLHQIFKSNLNLIYNQVGTVALASDTDIQDTVFVAIRLSLGSV